MPEPGIINYHLLLSRTVIIILMLTTGGCSTIEYYAQSIHGHMDIMNKREPIRELLNNKNINPALAEKLEVVLNIREFAISGLFLPGNDSYLEYADLKREFVVWNVFAAPAYSIQLEQWCFLIAGCLSYKGFYSREKAENFAAALEAENFDVYIGGVRAYSTLGWFRDPVLNTMLLKDDIYLAKLIFHELTHQKIYIKNDTEFNEAMAEAIARIGIIKWLEHTGDNNRIMEFKTQLLHNDRFFELVFETQNKLDVLYQSDKADHIKENEKNILFESMDTEYRALSKQWKNDDRFDAWFNDGLNNAKLAAIVTYRKLVPSFINIYNRLNQDLPGFYKILGKFENCSRERRRQILREDLNKFEC